MPAPAAAIDDAGSVPENADAPASAGSGIAWSADPRVVTDRDADADKIPVMAPLGTAMPGDRVGDAFERDVPSGRKQGIALTPGTFIPRVKNLRLPRVVASPGAAPTLAIVITWSERTSGRRRRKAMAGITAVPRVRLPGVAKPVGVAECLRREPDNGDGPQPRDTTHAEPTTAGGLVVNPDFFFLRTSSPGA